MILVADSGSTKCSWVLCSNSEKLQYFNTIGFNPFFIKRAEILEHLQKNDLHSISNKINMAFHASMGIVENKKLSSKGPVHINIHFD